MTFAGAFTALVTPFDTNGEVDYGKLRELVEQQAEAGIDGVVPVGTTGESPTLTVDEHLRVIETTVEAAAGRMQVIAGTGANCTREALELTEQARDAGIDGSLQVTPYYNKPNQQGLIRHFSAVADLGVPVVLYNIPGRTGRAIEIETLLELAGHPHIAAVKEAAGSVDRVSAIASQCDLTVLSGDDSLTFPMMAVGGKGVISVASNLIPATVANMVHMALDGRWDEARELHLRCFPLFDSLLSLDTNPIPIKAAMALRGMIEEVYRLPLCATGDDNRRALQALLETCDLD